MIFNSWEDNNINVADEFLLRLEKLIMRILQLWIISSIYGFPRQTYTAKWFYGNAEIIKTDDIQEI